MKKRIAVITNPTAGSYQQARLEKAIKLLESSGAELAILTSRCIGDCTTLAREQVSAADIIVAAGGDGTINEVANGLAGTDCKLGILPLGTTNVLMRELEMNLNIEKAVETILHGVPRQIHLGVMGERHFLLMAGIGFDAEIIYSLNLNWKRWLGRGAYAAAGLRLMFSTSKCELQVQADNQSFRGTFAVVSNGRLYAGPFPIAPQARLTEPLLDVCVFQHSSWPSLCRYMIGILRGQHLQFRDVQHVKAKEIKVEAKGTPVHVQLDGDLAGTLPATFSVRENALVLLVPPEKASSL